MKAATIIVSTGSPYGSSAYAAAARGHLRAVPDDVCLEELKTSRAASANIIDLRLIRQEPEHSVNQIGKIVAPAEQRLIHELPWELFGVITSIAVRTESIIASEEAIDRRR